MTEVFFLLHTSQDSLCDLIYSGRLSPASITDGEIGKERHDSDRGLEQHHS